MTNPYWGEAMRLVFMPRVPRLFVIIAEGVLLVLLRTKKKKYIYTQTETHAHRKYVKPQERSSTQFYATWFDKLRR